MIKSSVLNLIAAIFFLSILPVPVHALTPGQVFDKVKDAVVVVKTLDAADKVKAQGSGVLISSGRVATNCHVVEGGASYKVGRGKQIVAATLYAEDRDKDICILDVKGIKGKAVQLGKAAKLKVGDPVYAVGAPKGLELSLSDGIVAQLRGGPPPFIQTTAAISPGSSGGGLFDGKGRLVGLTTLYLEGGQSLNFAMPVEWIDDVKPGRKLAVDERGQTEWLKRVLALQELEDWQGLLDWCRMWTKGEPQNADAWLVIGVAYGNLNLHNDAIEAYHQAIRINPENALAHIGRGFAYSHLSQYQRAIKDFDEGIRLKPDDAEAYLSRGIAYMKLGQHQRAIKDYDEGLRLKPDDAVAYFNRGLSYAGLSQYQRATRDFDKAIRLKPHYTEAYMIRGNTYSKLGQYRQAIGDCDEAIRLKPNYAEAYFSRGIAYMKLGQYQRAIKDYDEVIRLKPDDMASYNNLGITYILSGNIQDGCRSIIRACELGDCETYKFQKQEGVCR